MMQSDALAFSCGQMPPVLWGPGWDTGQGRNRSVLLSGTDSVGLDKPLSHKSTRRSRGICLACHFCVSCRYSTSASTDTRAAGGRIRGTPPLNSTSMMRRVCVDTGLGAGDLCFCFNLRDSSGPDSSQSTAGRGAQGM